MFCFSDGVSRIPIGAPSSSHDRSEAVLASPVPVISGSAPQVADMVGERRKFYPDMFVNEIGCGDPITNSSIINFKWILSHCMQHQVSIYFFCAIGIAVFDNSHDPGSSVYAKQGFIFDNEAINWRTSTKIRRCLVP